MDFARLSAGYRDSDQILSKRMRCRRSAGLSEAACLSLIAVSAQGLVEGTTMRLTGRPTCRLTWVPTQVSQPPLPPPSQAPVLPLPGPVGAVAVEAEEHPEADLSDSDLEPSTSPGLSAASHRGSLPKVCGVRRVHVFARAVKSGRAVRFPTSHSRLGRSEGPVAGRALRWSSSRSPPPSVLCPGDVLSVSCPFYSSDRINSLHISRRIDYSQSISCGTWRNMSRWGPRASPSNRYSS